MGFATRKRLFRHMGFAHPVNPQEEFDNEENLEIILNPPPLAEVTTEKSRRGRPKGAKNRLKLDPDTGQLVRLLPTKKQKVKKEGGAPTPRKPRAKKDKSKDQNSSAALSDQSTASALWSVTGWPPNFP